MGEHSGSCGPLLPRPPPTPPPPVRHVAAVLRTLGGCLSSGSEGELLSLKCMVLPQHLVTLRPRRGLACQFLGPSAGAQDDIPSFPGSEQHPGSPGGSVSRGRARVIGGGSLGSSGPRTLNASQGRPAGVSDECLPPSPLRAGAVITPVTEKQRPRARKPLAPGPQPVSGGAGMPAKAVLSGCSLLWLPTGLPASGAAAMRCGRGKASEMFPFGVHF